MKSGREGAALARAHREIVGERVESMRLDALAHPFGELLRIRLRLAAAPHPVAQVVRHVARANYQNLVFRELAQRAPETQLMASPEVRLQRELHDRDLGLRIH